MVRWILLRALAETWGRQAIPRLLREAVLGFLVALLLAIIPGAPRVSEEIAVAFAIVGAVALLEVARYGLALLRLHRSHPGALRTRVVRVTPPDGRRMADFLLTIDAERWRRHRDGWVLAVHMSVENLTNERRAVPNFVIDSGARRHTERLDAEVLKQAQNLDHAIPESVDPNEIVDGWMMSPLAVRLTGGYPGYLVVTADGEDNWRGFTRLVVEEPRRREVEEIPIILEELGILGYWGGVIQGELVSRADALARGTHGDTAWRESAIEVHRESSPQRYVQWSQKVTNYLRDRIGRGYAFRFEAAWQANPTDVFARIAAQRGVLDELVSELTAQT